MFRAFIRKESVKRYSKSIVRKAKACLTLTKFLTIDLRCDNQSNLLLLLRTSDMSKFAFELLRKM